RPHDGRSDPLRAARALQARRGELGPGGALRIHHREGRMTPLARIVEALLFLSPEPVSLEDLRDATEQDEWAVLDALTELRDGLHGRGVVLKEVAGGWTLVSHPGAEEAARRLLSRPRTPALTPAQAE